VRIETLPLASLVADPRNPRTHDEKNLQAITDSLRKHGQVEPLLVQASTRMVVAGNGRMAAMRSLGWREAQVVLLDVSDQQARQLSIQLNRTGELAGWDAEVLQAHLRELDALGDTGWNAEEYGFSDADLTALFAEFEQPTEQPGTQPEPPVRSGGLIDDWGAPPFTLLDTRQGYWQERRRWWKSTGLDPNVGREFLSATACVVADYGSKRGDTEGGSTFDPALAELMVAWFSGVGDKVLDPFAGGPCRGVIAAALGRRYTGIDVRGSQVQANVTHWEQLAPRLPSLQRKVEVRDYQPELTPVQQVGNVWLKRDDLYSVAGVAGGKVRSCWALAQGATGLVTAGSRASPQVNIVAHIAKRLGVPCRVHTPEGEASEEVADAVACGAERVEHRPGHNSVIIARAREDAKARGWREIPFGMECDEAVRQTRRQVAGLPSGVRRIVIPVGSGMSLCGVLWGLRDQGLAIPVLGVVVGADPAKRLEKYAPPGWQQMVQLVPAGVDYHDAVQATVGDAVLDPHYEAKCARFLQDGDLLWIVGVRATSRPAVAERVVQPAPRWVEGDSRDIPTLLPSGEQYDAIVTCPPYADLEVYSDDPRDISTMPYEEFVAVFREIMRHSVERLREGGFAAIVMGEVRDKAGNLRGLIPDTIAAMVEAGASFYNDAILLNSAGSLPLRAGRYFRARRTLGRQHQYVLIFVKGQPRRDMPDPILPAADEGDEAEAE
jgi:hypothetical protein